MNSNQYWLVLCVEKNDEDIEQAINDLRSYMSNGGGVAMNRSRGTGINYRQMNQREKEIYEMGLRDSMTPEEKRIYEMGKRDAYGRNGAENHRNPTDF